MPTIGVAVAPDSAARERKAFHRLYGQKSRRAVYYKRDFLDYILMILVTAAALRWSYGPGHLLWYCGAALCVLMIATFIVRHGAEFRVPAVIRKPQEIFFMLLYKIQNLKPMFFAALGLLLGQSVLISFTPGIPHHTDVMKTVALWLFYIHLAGITAYRTIILFAHLGKTEHIREVLMQTAWQRTIKANTNMVLEVLHAYLTGILTHIVMIAPWFVIIQNVKTSIVFLPFTCLIDAAIHLKWMSGYNKWYYRDHWLGHNAELDFVYLHGTHHDAIPSGLIAVSENGLLEGFLRFCLGWPTPFYNPVMCFLISSYDIKTDIDMHQYIPGIFPKLPNLVIQGFQHSTHHYGPIEPYGIGARLDQPCFSEEFRKKMARVPEGIKNSAKLDEALTGFEWDNPTYRMILGLFEKYQR